MKIRNAEDEATKSGQVTLKYKFTIDMPEYAKRFGIEVPDDSSDTLNDNEDSACREELTDAQDASITVVGTPLSKCKANNPLTCRFHGTQAIANDIEAMMRAAGVQGNVNVDINGVSGNLLTVTAQITASAKDQPKIEAAMKQFFALPGVAGDTVDLIFDKSKNQHENLFQVDMLDPNASAKWGFGQNANQPQTKAKPKAKKPKQPQATPPSAPQPQVSAPTPAVAPVAPSPVIPPAQHGGRLHPPVRPADPGNWTGLDEQDMDFLSETGINIAYLAQRVNHNILKGSPGAGTIALQNFQKIDAKRLKSLAARDDYAKKVAEMYDLAKQSEQNNWTQKIESPNLPYDENTYNSSDPTTSTSYDKWGFDKNAVAGFATWKKAKDDFENWEDPAKDRANVLNGLSATISSSKDPNAPATAVADMDDASQAMTDIEQNILALEDAISKEPDAEAKSALEAVLADAEGSYYDADKKWNDAKQTVNKWLATQRTMTENYSYADVMDHFKSLGLPIPAGVENWESWVKKNEPDADKVVALRYGSRKGWQTPQERQARVAQLRKNMAKLIPYLHIYHCGSQFIESSLAANGSVRADETNRNYRNAMKNAFGANPSKINADNMQLYTVVSIEDNPKNSDWCEHRYRTDYVVELDISKTVGCILFYNSCGYWDHFPGSAGSLMNQVGLTDIAYNNGYNKFNPKSAEVDFEGMTPKQMFDIMFPGGERTLEFHPVNGGSLAQKNIKKVYSTKKLSPRAYAALKAAGVPNLDRKTGQPF